MLQDMRCPRCNRHVRTKDVNTPDVMIVKRPMKVKKCVHCGCKVKVVKDEPIGGVECWTLDTEVESGK